MDHWGQVVLQVHHSGQEVQVAGSTVEGGLVVLHAHSEFLVDQVKNSELAD